MLVQARVHLKDIRKIASGSLKIAPRTLPESFKIQPGASPRAKMHPRGAQDQPEGVQERPRGGQEAPKRCPRASKRRPRAPKMRPRGAREAPRTLQNRARGAFRRNVCTIFVQRSIRRAPEPIFCQVFAICATCASCKNLIKT